MSYTSGQGDFFDKARLWAVALLLLAGGCALLGSVLEWVTIVERPRLRNDINFGDNQNDAQIRRPEVTRPFSGIDARDGWYVLAAGSVLVLAALLLLLRRRSGFGWVAFLASVVIGAIAFADYRGVGDLSSSISQRMDIVGKARPGVGLTLVAAAGLMGLIGSVAGIAATPASRNEETA